MQDPCLSSMRSRAERITSAGSRPFVVAIVGGSGSGKTWLARKLQRALAPNAVRLSLDDFYRDRSSLPPARRAQLNFDHPRAIDWASFEQALGACRAGRPISIPRYDFATHCRRPGGQWFHPKGIVLVEGLWLLHRARLRRWFDFSIFVDAPTELRLNRRVRRDLCTRRRTLESVRRQFWKTVQPMHDRFVTPQEKQADLRWQGDSRTREVATLLEQLRRAMKSGTPGNRPS